LKLYERTICSGQRYTFDESRSRKKLSDPLNLHTHKWRLRDLIAKTKVGTHHKMEHHRCKLSNELTPVQTLLQS